MPPLARHGTRSITVVKSGTDPDCTGSSSLPIIGLPWMATTDPQIAPTTTLASTASSTDTGYAVTTRWSLAPS